MKFAVDPRHGDIEDDASSTKQRSLMSLAGSMLVEISPLKLALTWLMLLVIPGLLLGFAPIVATAWVRSVSGRIISLSVGLWSLLILLAFLLGRLVRRTDAAADRRTEFLVTQRRRRRARLWYVSRDAAPYCRKTAPAHGKRGAPLGPALGMRGHRRDHRLPGRPGDHCRRLAKHESIR